MAFYNCWVTLGETVFSVNFAADFICLSSQPD